MLFKSNDFDEMYTDPETLEEYPAWKNDFEARFPDDTYEDTTQLKTFMDWIVTTDRSQATNNTLESPVTIGGVEYTTDSAEYRLAKFGSEIGDYAEIDSLVFYYIFTEFFLLVDSRAKNLFIGFHGSECQIEGMRRKLVAEPYDMDTGLGTNNEGTLTYGYNLEDLDTLGGSDVFNGQNSVLWCNLRDSKRAQIVQMYQTLRSSGGLSYDAVEARYEEAQDTWPEAVWNEDGQVKYIEPLTNPESGKEPTDFYLPMCQGSKEQQRKWWMGNRFAYMDSKWNAGDALQQVIQLRGYAKANITVTPYIDLYNTVKYGSYLVQNKSAAGVPAVMVCPMDSVNDTEIYIYSAPHVASVGDLSGLKVGVADFSAAINLQEVKVGDSDANYDNPNMKRLSFGNNVLLKTVDARNCSALGTDEQKTVDMSNCAIIENIYFDGTSIQGLTLPNGGMIKKIHVPATMTNLTILNQKHITEFVIPAYTNISTLRIENSSLDTKAMLNAIPANTRVRLIGIDWTCQDNTEIEALLDKLDTMRGLDESGNNVAQAQISGTIRTEALTGAQVASYMERYPHITYDAHVRSTRTYADYDGTVLKAVTCVDGVPQEGAPSNPTRTSTAQYTYTFVGWSKSMNAETADSDALDNVLQDRTIYAAYSKRVNTYTITWADSYTGTLATETYEYGATPSYKGTMPTHDGQTAQGWTPTIHTVTGNQTYTTTYLPVYTVNWYNGSTLLKTEQVIQGSNATPPSGTPVSPDGADYTFIGWDKTYTNVQSNLNIYAQYKAPTNAPTATTADGAYGVEWDYNANATGLTRKGLAAAFADPTPATSVSGTGSSPFDNIAPWKDMKAYCMVNGSLVDSSNASFDPETYDTLVYIPEFYYTAFKDENNSKWLWAISPTQLEGYVKHPGSGRYIGRYHTSGSSAAVYSKSGVNPLANTSQTDFRTYSTAKGTGWYMLDLATWSALQMLYLVEFADFYSQNTLGTGWNTGSVGQMGGTDGAAYHTIKASGAHNMYRWVEDPFSNVRDWVDGFIGSKYAIYIGTTPSTYNGTTTTLTQASGLKLPSSGYISGLGYSEESAWAFIPEAASGSESTYVTDYVYSNASAYPVGVGGSYNADAIYGLFYFNANNSASITSASLGSRLLYLP